MSAAFLIVSEKFANVLERKNSCPLLVIPISPPLKVLFLMEILDQFAMVDFEFSVNVEWLISTIPSLTLKIAEPLSAEFRIKLESTMESVPSFRIAPLTT